MILHSPTRIATPSPLRWLGGLGVRGVHRGVVRARLRRAGLAARVREVGPARVHAWEGGRGRPLLLLHGFGSDAAWTWHANVASLAAGRRLIVPDLLFFGGSHSVAEDYSLEHQVASFLGALDAAGVDDFDVVGISYGGLVAWAMARQVPERIGRVVLVGSPGPSWSDQERAQALARLGVDDLADVVLPRGPAGVRRLIELAWHRPPPTPSFVLDFVHGHLFSDRVEEKRALLAHLEDRRGTVDPADQDLPHPTLLLWGEHDPLFPVSVGERLRDRLSDARLVVLPGARHAPNLERPREFGAQVASFLAEGSARSARPVAAAGGRR